MTEAVATIAPNWAEEARRALQEHRPRHVPRTMWPEVCRLLVVGLRPEEVRAKLDITKTQWDAMSQAKGFVKHLASRQQAADERMLDARQGTQMVLEASAVRAAETLVDLLTSENEMRRHSAAKVLLERVLGKPSQHVEVAGAVMHGVLKLTDDERDWLLEVAKEVRGESQRNDRVIDVEAAG